MDFGGLLVLGAVWLLFNLLGRGRSEGRSRPRTGPHTPQPGSYPGGSGDGSTADATQLEGSRLEQILRQLERGLEEAGGVPTRAPTRRRPAPLPDDEDVEDRESLEEPEQVVSLETEVKRPPRVEYDQDSGAEDLLRKRIADAEARSGPRKRGEHVAFDARIRQQPADHTAVRRYNVAQLRNAVVWREILGPPVSERDR